MTTIAYRDGVLAADSIISVGGSLGSHTDKIARRADGHMAGGAGTCAYWQRFCTWFMAGENGDPPEAKVSADFLDRGVIFRPDGSFEVFEPEGMSVQRGNYYAMGSGRAEALGAMFAGADAPTAVRAGIEHDSNSGGSVMVLSHAGEPA